MFSYPAAIPLSNRTLARLAELIRARRRSRWRRLKPGQQALLVLAHLRNGGTYARLAAGFAIGTTTAWRYARESVDLLAALADDVQAAALRAARLAYAILDGTLIPIDRVADQKPYYSGKHKRHGVNVQVLADPAGRLVWASPALPGAVHDLTAARTVGLINAPTDRQRRHDLRRQGLPRRGRRDPHPVQARHRLSHGKTMSTAPTHVSEPSANAHRDPQSVEAAVKAPLLSPPRHPDRAGRPCPASRRRRPLLRIKKLSRRSTTAGALRDHRGAPIAPAP
ncbi:hypothetical protein Mame01_28710 [Microbispora amethystogenes]|nr:hypothetical protein Mame01_28710 [Microbispora amethystogenes]